MASLARVVFFAFIAVCSVFSALSENPNPIKLSHVKELSRQEFAAFSERPSVTIVYFFRKDVQPVRKFLTEYDKSAELLKNYNVELARLDCTADDSIEAGDYCDEDGTEENLYAFRSGHELLALPLENTFDVNSIMSNVLQIVLLREVPIIQTLDERQEVEAQNKGKHDVILSYQAAIGTYEHRVLMEVAFAYHHKYKFIITTEKPAIADLVGSRTGENSMLWVLQCKQATMNAPCTQSKVLENIDLVSLARFLKVLNLKLVHDITKEGLEHPYDKHNVHKVFLYYSRPQHGQAMLMAERITKTFYGVVAAIMVDVEHPQAAMFGYTHDVSGIPSVAVLLRDSNEPVYMQGTFTWLSVDAFIGRILESTLRSITPLTEEETYDSDEEEKLLAAVEKQDDQVAEAVSRLSREEPDRTHIPALTDTTFKHETTKHPLKIVLFYLTFDARSMAFMRSYVDASLTLAKESLTPLTAMDCFDWTDVCGKNNITTYPTIRVYRKGKPAFDYRGMLGAAPIVSLVKLLLADAPASLNSHQEALQFLDGVFPVDLKSVTDISVLGVFGKNHKKELKELKKAAKKEHGNIVYGYLTGDDTITLCEKFNTRLPAVIVYKRHDMWDPHRVFQGQEMTSSSIVDFVKDAALPIFPELTPMNFPAYFAHKKPFVILFDEHVKPGEGSHAQVAAAVKTGEFHQFVFGWMELTRDDGVAGKVLLEYNRNADPPALFVVDHASGMIYNFASSDISEATVTSWLHKVNSKEIMPWKMLEEGEWKPLNPGYDFLKMIDEENADDEPPASEPTMSMPKMELDLTPPGEDEENQVREALKHVQGDAMTEKGSEHDNTGMPQHTEL